MLGDPPLVDRGSFPKARVKGWTKGEKRRVAHRGAQTQGIWLQ